MSSLSSSSESKPPASRASSSSTAGEDLLLDLVDGDGERRVLAGELLGPVVVGEGELDLALLARRGALELLLEAGDEPVRAELDELVGARAAGELLAVDRAAVVHDDEVARLRGALRGLQAGRALAQLLDLADRRPPRRRRARAGRPRGPCTRRASPSDGRRSRSRRSGAPAGRAGRRRRAWGRRRGRSRRRRWRRSTRTRATRAGPRRARSRGRAGAGPRAAGPCRGGSRAPASRARAPWRPAGRGARPPRGRPRPPRAHARRAARSPWCARSRPWAVDDSVGLRARSPRATPPRAPRHLARRLPRRGRGRLGGAVLALELRARPRARTAVVSQGSRTAEPTTSPPRRSVRACSASSSAYVVTCVRTGIRGASASISSPSRLVRLATDRIERSSHRSS